MSTHTQTKRIKLILYCSISEFTHSLIHHFFFLSRKWKFDCVTWVWNHLLMKKLLMKWEKNFLNQKKNEIHSFGDEIPFPCITTTKTHTIRIEYAQSMIIFNNTVILGKKMVMMWIYNKTIRTKKVKTTTKKLKTKMTEKKHPPSVHTNTQESFTFLQTI